MIYRDSLDGFPWDNEAEYTRDCGWIDWSHATPGKKDLQAIWMHLPHEPFESKERRQASEQLSVNLFEMTLRDATTGVEYQYYHVTFPLDSDGWTTHWNDDLFRFYVRVKNPKNLYYERAALALYQYASEKAESYQSDSVVTRHSGWAMEDLVSDLIAFYRHVFGLTQKEVIDKAGGWLDRTEAEQYSKLVLNVMWPNGVHTPQPKTDASRWEKAFLCNHILGLTPYDSRHGWKDLPKYFRSIKPLTIDWSDSLSGVIGADILMATPKVSQKLVSAPNKSLLEQTRFLAHQQAQLPSADFTGGVGRRSGPLGVA
jgi:hypothetical protein